MLEDPADARLSAFGQAGPLPGRHGSRRYRPEASFGRAARRGAWRNFRKPTRSIPSNSMAEQELKRTKEMIEREKNPQGRAAATPEERGLTPAERAQKEIDEKMSRMMAAPELKPINPQLSTTLKMNNQPVRVLYETVGKLAGINVVFDPEYQAPPGKLELHHRSFEHHPRRGPRLYRHSDQVLLETALIEYDFCYQRQRHEAPRLRRLRSQGVLHQERDHAAGTAGNLDDGPLGHRNPPRLRLQRPDTRSCFAAPPIRLRLRKSSSPTSTSPRQKWWLT